MLEKHRIQEGVYCVALQVPLDMVKAELPESQSPAMEYHIRGLQRLYCHAIKSLPPVSRQSNLRLMGDWK